MFDAGMMASRFDTCARTYGTAVVHLAFVAQGPMLEPSGDKDFTFKKPIEDPNVDIAEEVEADFQGVVTEDSVGAVYHSKGPVEGFLCVMAETR